MQKNSFKLGSIVVSKDLPDAYGEIVNFSDSIVLINRIPFIPYADHRRFRGTVRTEKFNEHFELVDAETAVKVKKIKALGDILYGDGNY